MKSPMNTPSRFILLCLVMALFAANAKAEAAEKDEVKVLSFNVLTDPVHAEVRLPALFAILEKSDADVIGLQEVAPWFLAELDKQAWSRRYHSYMADGKRVAPGGLLVLSKAPVTKLAANYLPSRQRRAYVIAETQVRGITVAVANCHLESPLESGALRAQQLALYFRMLESSAQAIFLGDFNFGDGEQPETDQLPASYLDAWQQTQGEEAGFTWNIEKSRMAELGSFPNEKSRRLDRILIRSPHWVPFKAEIIGSTQVTGQPGVFPSDHFGLLATLRMK